MSSTPAGRMCLAEVIRRFGKPSFWGGGGVDVVVNYLGGETSALFLACLCPHLPRAAPVPVPT